MSLSQYLLVVFVPDHQVLKETLFVIWSPMLLHTVDYSTTEIRNMTISYNII